MHSERFLRALFPLQFPDDAASRSKSELESPVHRNKRVKYVHERLGEDVEGGGRRRVAERVTVDPEGDLLLVLRERGGKEGRGRKKIEGAVAVLSIEDSAIGIETTDAETETETETEVEAGVEVQVQGEDGYIGDVEKEKEKEKELREIHMLVSSKHMVLVSPVFKAMLQWTNFKDGYATKAHGKVEVPLPDDDPDAMRILVDIVHSVLVDKYRLHEAVQIYSDMWISHAKKEVSFFDGGRWGGDSAWAIPIPSNVVEHIEQDRIRALDEAISALRDTMESYQSSTLICRGRPTYLSMDEIFQHNKQCDAMTLGMLIKEAIHHNLYPLPEAPYTGHSFVSVYDSYQSFNIKNACEVVLLCSSHPSQELSETKHIFGGFLMDLMVPIEKELCGLDLDGFKVSSSLV
ncbi:hypothetical protein DID88_000135 [Monilinia fructigena]|uniref:BTB domain-containing protein n=1 Tax=Monilinia fructigena TaxID=38457 RepID=A0A395IPT2_9HELO|nr:hypothetical protein DID88_000135 [Monilinia fructigena]